jgi:DNA-binding NtrC family response regulator
MSASPFEPAAPRGRLLLVEDCSVLRELVLLVLQRAGYHTAVCESSDEARAVAGRETFDVILLNSDRAEIEDADFLRDMRSSATRSVVVMTWVPSAKTAADLRSRGATVVLERTTNPTAILGHLEAQFVPTPTPAPRLVAEADDERSALSVAKPAAEWRELEPVG